MTSLAGEFHTDLSPPDTLAACAEAIHGLGWQLKAVEGKRIVSYTDSERPPMIEVALSDPGEGTDLRIIGSDTEASPLNTEELVAELNRARDAIQEMVEEAEETQASARGGPAGWYPDAQDDGKLRYWDGHNWTDRIRPEAQPHPPPVAAKQSRPNPPDASPTRTAERRIRQTQNQAAPKQRGGSPRRHRRKMTGVIAIAAVGGTLLCTAIGAALLRPDGEPGPEDSNASHSEAPKPKPKPDPKRIVVDQQAPIPVDVEVPAVDISARVVPLGLTDGGALEVPEDFSTAGWWSSGPEPGERGAAVITAHIDSKTGPAAFYTLADASPGDEVYVHRKDGSTATFVIHRLRQYPKDDFPTHQVYDKTPEPTLRLITCGGIFDDSIGHYRDNIVAYATRKPTYRGTVRSERLKQRRAVRRSS
jgi:sortase (surface protein transpeptidase)